MDLSTYLRGLENNGSLALIRDNPAAQFGTPQQPYLGATLLPERLQPNNIYKEANIRYRTVVANAGTRYSPVQLKSTGRLVGEFMVDLSNSDIGLEMDSNDYDAILQYLGRNGNMEQVANTVMNLADNAIAGLAMHNERMRWQALVNASVVLTGDNAYAETVPYSNPTGHRVATAGVWTTDTYDPYQDILERQTFLAGKGYRVARIITSTRVANILGGNEQMARRFAPIARTLGTNTYLGRLTPAAISGGMTIDGLPPIEIYDAIWFDQLGNGRFLPDNVMVFTAVTDRAENVPTMNGEMYLPNLVGYTGIGRPAGQAVPGRVLRVEAQDKKPPTVKVEAWQTSLPVITDPESVAVLTGIA